MLPGARLLMKLGGACSLLLVTEPHPSQSLLPCALFALVHMSWRSAPVNRSVVSLLGIRSRGFFPIPTLTHPAGLSWFLQLIPICLTVSLDGSLHGMRCSGRLICTWASKSHALHRRRTAPLMLRATFQWLTSAFLVPQSEQRDLNA